MLSPLARVRTSGQPAASDSALLAKNHRRRATHPGRRSFRPGARTPLLAHARTAGGSGYRSRCAPARPSASFRSSPRCRRQMSARTGRPESVLGWVCHHRLPFHFGEVASPPGDCSRRIPHRGLECVPDRDDGLARWESDHAGESAVLRHLIVVRAAFDTGDVHVGGAAECSSIRGWWRRAPRSASQLVNPAISNAARCTALIPWCAAGVWFRSRNRR